MSSALRTGAIALTVLLRAVCVTSIPLTTCGIPGAQHVLNASGYCIKGGAAVEALPVVGKRGVLAQPDTTLFFTSPATPQG